MPIVALVIQDIQERANPVNARRLIIVPPRMVDVMSRMRSVRCPDPVKIRARAIPDMQDQGNRANARPSTRVQRPTEAATPMHNVQ
jgi:hypothetical protein